MRSITHGWLRQQPLLHPHTETRLTPAHAGGEVGVARPAEQAYDEAVADRVQPPQAQPHSLPTRCMP